MTIAAAVMVAVIPGMTPVGEPPILGIAAFALFMALINASIKPIVHLVSLPFAILSLGLDQLAVYAPSQLAGRQPLRCRCLCTRLPVVRARLSGLDHRLQHRWRHHRSVMRVPAQEQK